jgi:hypothetical protein
MHSGHYAAQNIHKMVVKNHVGQEPEFMEFQEVPPMIGLAVGKKAVASGPEGVVFGEDIMQAYFKNDLGFTSKLPFPRWRMGRRTLSADTDGSLLGLDGPGGEKAGEGCLESSSIGRREEARGYSWNGVFMLDIRRWRLLFL